VRAMRCITFGVANERTDVLSAAAVLSVLADGAVSGLYLDAGFSRPLTPYVGGGWPYYCCSSMPFCKPLPTGAILHADLGMGLLSCIL